MLRTATHALGGHARKARQRIGDGKVRQLTNVFSGNDFDNRGRSALGIERALDRAANAGDDNRVAFNSAFNSSRLFGVLRQRRCAGRGQRQKGRRPAQQARVYVDPVHFHQSPLPASDIERTLLQFFS